MTFRVGEMSAMAMARVVTALHLYVNATKATLDVIVNGWHVRPAALLGSMKQPTWILLMRLVTNAPTGGIAMLMKDSVNVLPVSKAGYV